MKKLTPKLVKAIHKRFPPQAATDLVVWLEGAFQPGRILARPSRSVREALGEDLIDELMDFIIAARETARPRQN